MRTTTSRLCLTALFLLPALASAADFQRTTIERFDEQCSAERVILITLRSGQNITLMKGQHTGYVPVSDFGVPESFHQPNPPGELKWHCGDTAERSGCPLDATHVKVERDRRGRAMHFTCVRVEKCTEGFTRLDTLEDRCGEDRLKVGGRSIPFNATVGGIPFSSAKLDNQGRFRWYCDDSAERSRCPTATTTLEIERHDRDTRLFKTKCLKKGAQCERWGGQYP